MKFTVFTPTYNRASTLPRVYNSLLNQTLKDFVWLIIDDGSTDNTRELVKRWIDEKNLLIEYHYKENGGKHSAMRLAWNLAKTKYLIGIDSDDELTYDAVETFNHEWGKIEFLGIENEFAEVSGLTHSKEGKLIGNFHFPSQTPFIDSFWHEMVLKYKNYNEQCPCRNLEKLKECVSIPEVFWLSDKISFLSEGTFWARIGRKYKTRYINKGVRIYHYDASESLLRIKDKKKGHYNNLVGTKFFLDENLDYFLWDPKFFINPLLKLIVSGIELNIKPKHLLSNINSLRLKLFYVTFFPLGVLAWVYFKHIKKRFWF